MNKFDAKAIEVKALGKVYESVEELIRYESQVYRVVGKKQETKWNRELGESELVWEDEEKTIPKMVDDWGYVDIPEDQLDEDNVIKIGIWQKVLAMLEKMA